MKKSLFFTVAVIFTCCFMCATVHAQDNTGQNTNQDTSNNSGIGSAGDSLELQTQQFEVDNRINSNQLIGGGQVGNEAGQAAAGGARGGGGGRAGNAGRAATRQPINNNTQQNQRVIRAPLRLGFQYVGRSASQIANTTTIRFRTLPRFVSSNVQVGISGKTAILRGNVSKASDKRVAEMVVMFEPGVSKVENNIVVEGN